jgi:hypothetical protein
MSAYFAMNAWREILARIFDDIPGQDNISPPWLINPATRRRLKLDRYYPDVGVAIRFVGLSAKGQRRQSDGEAMETQQRDQIRAELCRINSVQLALIDPNQEPVEQLDGLLRVLARASRMLATGDRPDQEKLTWMPTLADARERTSELRALIRKRPEQMMANLAESWRDRESGLIASPGAEPERRNEIAAAGAPPVAFTPGLRVRHSHFGEGVVTDVNDSDGDATVSILFDAAEQKTFLISLLSGKIETL